MTKTLKQELTQDCLKVLRILYNKQRMYDGYFTTEFLQDELSTTPIPLRPKMERAFRYLIEAEQKRYLDAVEVRDCQIIGGLKRTIISRAYRIRDDKIGEIENKIGEVEKLLGITK